MLSLFSKQGSSRLSKCIRFRFYHAVTLRCRPSFVEGSRMLSVVDFCKNCEHFKSEKVHQIQTSYQWTTSKTPLVSVKCFHATGNQFYSRRSVDNTSITDEFTKRLNSLKGEQNHKSCSEQLGDKWETNIKTASPDSKHFKSTDRNETFQSVAPAQSSIEDIEEFVYDKEEQADEIAPKVIPVELKRGKSGVYDLDELMIVLGSVNARDPCVIKIPEYKSFVDYMVIVSGMSFRHMYAIAAEVNWIYKRKKDPEDSYTKIEGGKTSKNWLAMDLGNIALHIFMPETRQQYDLETLWTCGSEFDPLCQMDSDPYFFTEADLFLMEVNRNASKNTNAMDSACDTKEVVTVDTVTLDGDRYRGIDNGPKGGEPTLGVSKKGRNGRLSDDNDDDRFMGIDNRPKDDQSKFGVHKKDRTRRLNVKP